MTKCLNCGVSLDYDISGLQKVEDGYMCDNCYFSQHGDLIDIHPIVDPEHIKRKEILEKLTQESQDMGLY